MSDFVVHEPSAHTATSEAAVDIKTASPADARGLASVMAARGGTAEGHLDPARRLIKRLPVLLIAESIGAAVGWCGVQRHSIVPELPPEWLVAGLTVLPEQRRRGIALRLLRDVLDATADAAPGEPIFSAINAQNPASVDLHIRLGFVEVARAETFAGITFTGGEGVLLRHP